MCMYIHQNILSDTVGDTAEDIVGNIAEDFVGTEDTLREGVPADKVTV